MKFDLKTIIGKTKEEAEAILEKNKFECRIESEDGEPQGLSMDFNDSRVNLTLEDGKVTSYSVG